MPPEQQASALAEFLTPEAMLTPGIAGSLTMMITNALTVNFGSPRAWTGLVLSFLFGLLVLISTKSILTKAVFYVLNSLVIFCVALGTNGIGTGTASSNRTSLGLVSSAFAQASSDSSLNNVDKTQLEHCANIASIISDAQKNGASNDDILKLVAPCQTLSRDIQGKSGESNSVEANPARKPFFAPWIK